MKMVGGRTGVVCVGVEQEEEKKYHWAIIIFMCRYPNRCLTLEQGTEARLHGIYSRAFSRRFRDLTCESDLLPSGLSSQALKVGLFAR